MSTNYIYSDILFANDFPNALLEKDIAKTIKKYYKERKIEKMTDWHIYFPVIEIDGISVRPQFIYNDKGFSLIVRTHNLWMYKKKRLITMDAAFICKPILYRKNYMKKLDKYLLGDYIELLKNIHYDIRCMKLNKLDGVLYTPDCLNPFRRGQCIRSDDENNNCLPCDQERPEECCVCLDTTKTTTHCGHKLCVVCWDKVKVLKQKLPCPICRSNLRQREQLQHLFPEGYIGLDNMYQDFYDEEDDGEDGQDDEHDDINISVNFTIDFVSDSDE